MKSLRLRICLISLVVVLVTSISVGFISIKTAKTNLEKQMINALTESVNSTADALFAENEKEYKMLETLAAIPQIRDPKISLLEKTHIIYGAMSTDKDYVDVCILDADGYAWINNGASKISFAERDYFKIPFKTGKRSVMDPFINKVNNTMAVFYSVPVFDSNNKVINVIFCVIDGFKPSDIASSHKAGNNRSTFLVSTSSGLTIGSEDHEAVAVENIFNEAAGDPYLDYYSALQNLRGSNNSGAISYKYADKKYILGYAKVPDTNWVAVNTIPYSDFQNDINAMRNKIILFGAIFVAICIVLLSLFINRAMKPLTTVKNVINEIATGNADLTKKIPISSNDEIGAVVKGFNQFEEKLRLIVSDIKSSKEELAAVGLNMNSNAQETTNSISSVYSHIENMKSQIDTQSNSVNLTAAAVTQISSNIQALERMVESQVTGVTQASSAVEEMIGNISSVNNAVTRMASSFDDLLTSAQGGVEKQNLVSSKIKEIENQSEALQGANLTISKIASQTNLLAMNAAIEAAHAGDAGRGFSVVADEIKKLSETSSHESNKISEQLEQIIISVQDVVSASNESTKAFKMVADLINSTNNVVKQITYAMEEQNAGSQQISEALHVMNDTTSEVRSASHEMAEGNKSILAEVNNLQEATHSMLQSMNEITAGADKINLTGAELGNIAPKMQSSIDDISSQIDQFKI